MERESQKETDITVAGVNARACCRRPPAAACRVALSAPAGRRLQPPPAGRRRTPATSARTAVRPRPAVRHALAPYAGIAGS
uniref:Uncharacterized protein n=1 Tax=Leersia perrieri TaxID=77586 RepID=A0A0D9V1T8_9ORYZ